jgi:hypothetical protein
MIVCVRFASPRVSRSAVSMRSRSSRVPLVRSSCFGELDFLLGDHAAELVQRLVGGDEIEFLLREFFAGFVDVLVVLADAGFELGFALVVEGHAALGGVQCVAVLVEALAEFGEFAFENRGRRRGLR